MNDVREVFKRWPKFYFFISAVFGPMMFCRLSSKKFLIRYPSDGKILNLGSGPRIIAAGVTNVDRHPYAGVTLTADITELPLPAGSAKRIVSDNVLEHVKNPQSAVREIHRLLDQGGLAYISTPFLYPYHSSPSDYQRWSKEGLVELFKEFEMVEIGVRAGPFSGLTVYLCHLFGFIFSFGSTGLNSILTNCIMFVLFPLKFLDLIFNYWPQAHTMASVLYCVVRKK